MLALLFLTGAALLGACLTRRVLRGALGAWEHALWGLVAGWVAATLTAYALARAQGRLTYETVAWTTLLVWAGVILLLAPALLRLRAAWPRRAALLRARAVPGREHFWMAAVLLVPAPVYWHLFSTHTFAPGEGGLYSGGSAWGDMSFHAALATSFAHGENFPPVYTPLPPEPLLYPFMPDFQAGALMAAGLGLREAMLWTALPLALAVTGIFYQFALRLAASRGAAALATALYLLGGGLGFVELPRDWLASGKGFREFWGTLGVNYANAWERGIHWNNIIADTFVPQRTSLYGLPAALMIFTLFWVVWRREDGGEGKGSDAAWRLLFMAGMLAGVLPLFHAHTYAAVGFVSVFLFLLRPRRAWLAFWAPALLLAAPHLLALARHAAGGGFLRLLPGWMGHEEPYLSAYLLRNFGLPLVLAVPAWLAAPRAWRTFYLPFALLFAFALVVVFSPNTFDNGKVIYHWHAVNSALVGSWLFRLAYVRRQRLLASLLAFACVASGLTALQSEGLKWERLFSEDDLAAADFARAHTSPRSLFLTAPVINQPVLSLAGRAVVRGPTFWPWSHGYEFRAREADVRRMYAGGAEALELLRYYGVDYVYLGAAERDGLRADASFYEANFPAAYRGAGVAIYDTRRALTAATVGGALGIRLRPPAPRELSERVGRDPFALVEEFSQTSLFVYRMLKAAHGRAPTREEFMPALKTLGRGLYPGADGWERRLGANRRALAEHLAAGDAARASELLRAAEGGAADAREYDEAYVLVHFFGYLGRDPGTPPDRDMSGFNFWLDALGRTRDYRSLSRAFLESEEYKRHSERIMLGE